MSNQNPHKPGYKHTPLGWIPEEWEAVRIEDVAKLNPSRTILQDEEDVSFLGMADVSEEGKIVNGFIRKYGEVKNGFTYFKDGDILVAKITPCFENGKGALANNLKNGIGFGSTEFQVIRSGEKLCPTYLFYHTRLYRFRGHGEQNMTGSAGQKRVPTDFIETYKIPLPPLPEQHKIAAILSAWDEAITKTQQLIAQLQQRNKGLMQQLLTGKKRLKGFEGEWNKIQFEDCFQFIKSYSISRDGLSQENDSKLIYCIHYGDIHALYDNDFLDFRTQHDIPQIKSGTVVIDKKDFLKEGDIVIADASEDYEGVGEAVEVINLNDKEAVGGLHTIVIRDVKGLTTNKFRAFLFASEVVRNELRKKATGTSVYSVTKTTMKSLQFSIPNSKEQHAIANVLHNAINEIKLYEQKLAALQQQKKGLMQKLLTGEVRVNLLKQHSA